MTEAMKQRSNDIAEQVIGAAIEVHRNLGPGLLESVYETCLCYELELLNLKFERQKKLPILYKKTRLDGSLRIDILIEEIVILEIKAVEKIIPIHHAQLLTYLKLQGLWLGLILNFNSVLMKSGIKRLVNG